MASLEKGGNAAGSGVGMGMETSSNDEGSLSHVLEERGSKGTIRSLDLAAKILSTGLYLVDYLSTILVLRGYYVLDKRGEFSNVQDYKWELSHHVNLLPFYLCLGFMILHHVAAAVAFKLKLPPEEHPLRSAYFLPIVQFRRFIAGILKTAGLCASVGSESPESLETEALYAVISAIETGPQVIIQVTVIVLVGESSDWFPPPIVVSVVTSILSASYNTGRTVMYQISKRWSFKLDASGIAGGMYTFGTLLLRCTAVASVILMLDVITVDDLLRVSKSTRRLLAVPYFGGGICLLSYLSGLFTVLLSKGRNLCSWAAQLEAMVDAYITGTIGPLYPIVYGYNTRSSTYPKRTLCTHLGLAAGLNLLVDVVPLIVLAILKLTACDFGVRPKSLRGSTFGDGADSHKTLLVWMNTSSTLTCHPFMSYAGTGVALTVLSCTILLCLSVLPRRNNPVSRMCCRLY